MWKIRLAFFRPLFEAQNFSAVRSAEIPGRVIHPTSPARRHRLQPWQSAAPAGLAARHPELVPDEPAAAAVQDGRPPHPTCAVLHPATGRKLLDGEPLLADSRPHRATRVAPHVIARTVQAGSRLGAARSVPPVGGYGRRTTQGDAGSAELAPRARPLSPIANEQHGWGGHYGATRQPETEEKWVHIANPGSSDLSSRSLSPDGRRRSGPESVGLRIDQ